MTTANADEFDRKLNAKISQTRSKSPALPNQPQANSNQNKKNKCLRGSVEDKGRVDFEQPDGGESDKENRPPSRCTMLISNSRTANRDKWILDSSANTHGVKDLKWFVDYHEFEVDIANAGENKALHIKGGGTIAFTTWTPSREPIEILLTRVAYSPKLRCNIISMSQLGKVGNLRGTWTDGRVNIADSNGTVVGQAIERDGLYVVECNPLNDRPEIQMTTQLPEVARPGGVKETPRKTQNRHNCSRAIEITVLGGVRPLMVISTIDFRDPV